jgi:hypothetical protein
MAPGSVMDARTRRAFLLAFVAVAAAWGCRRGATPVPQEIADGLNPADPYAMGVCEVNVSGSELMSLKSPGGYDHVETDYWVSEEHMRDRLLADAHEDLVPPDEIEVVIEQGMRRDPRYVLLTFMCENERASLVFAPGRRSTYGDVPFGPGKYAIAPVARVEDAIRGDFVVDFQTYAGGVTTQYVAAETGELMIDAFDADHLAGSYAFEARSTKSPSRTVTVEGWFDFKNTAPPWYPTPR